MDIGRRELLAGVAGFGLAGIVGPSALGFAAGGYSAVTGHPWHPLIRSLLDRAERAGQRLDRARVERIVHEVAGEDGRPVIKWMESPERAFEHLLRYPLDELSQMPTAQLWPFPPPISAGDRDAEERSIELRWQANQALSIDEHGRALMLPKLEFRARAVASQSEPEAIFEARAIAAEIGWIETSLPGAAAGAILALENLLSAGHAEASEAIHHQLLVFEAFESGLLATWETPGEIVCVPMIVRA